MTFKIRTSLFLLFLMVFFALNAIGEGYPEVKKNSISGHIKDVHTGEMLIGATVYVQEAKTGASTNLYGFYSLSMIPGTYTLTFSYIGYRTEEKSVILDKDINLEIELSGTEEILQEVVITGERQDKNVKSAEMSVIKMESKTIRQIPALFGEIDVIRALQLMPGVKAVAEGSTGFSVRGGSADQNLVLLDEATVYNAGHLLGFFSVFNNDAVKDVTLYKGDIPAAYGGRLSSLLDVRMKEGNSKKFSATGGIGLISSRLTLEGPIVNEKTSFIVSGRRTYADIFIPVFGKEELKGNKLYFYDFNAKLNHTIDEKNRVFVSAYLGQDVFKNEFALMQLGNGTITARWNHLFSQKLFFEFHLS
jgi:hypothetical protein